MTLKIDMFIGPKMVDVRGQTDPQKTLPKGSRKGGPKGGVIEFPPEVFFRTPLERNRHFFFQAMSKTPPLWDPFGRPRLGFQIFAKIRKWTFRRGEGLVSIIL